MSNTKQKGWQITRNGIYYSRGSIEECYCSWVCIAFLIGCSFAIITLFISAIIAGYNFNYQNCLANEEDIVMRIPYNKSQEWAERYIDTSKLKAIRLCSTYPENEFILSILNQENQMILNISSKSNDIIINGNEVAKFISNSHYCLTLYKNGIITLYHRTGITGEIVWSEALAERNEALAEHASHASHASLNNFYRFNNSAGLPYQLCSIMD